MDGHLGVLVGAVALGVTHALEPDHVAGITALTSESRGPVRSAIVGACFGLGHAVLVAAWVAIGALVLGPRSAGLAGVDGLLGVVLLLVGLVVGRAGLRTLRGDEATHGHLLAVPGLAGAADPGRTRGYLAVGVVGALFTLSPPLSMLAFVSGVLPAAGPGVAGLAVLAYTAAITTVLGAVGGGAGWLFARLGGRGRRLRGAGQLLAAGVVSGMGVAVLVA